LELLIGSIEPQKKESTKNAESANNEKSAKNEKSNVAAKVAVYVATNVAVHVAANGAVRMAPPEVRTSCRALRAAATSAAMSARQPVFTGVTGAAGASSDHIVLEECPFFVPDAAPTRSR
jgi:hypothetical protein